MDSEPTQAEIDAALKKMAEWVSLPYADEDKNRAFMRWVLSAAWHAGRSAGTR
jgi:hypothetical protein